MLSGKGVVYYIASRILRIYPALVVCVLLSVFLLGPLLNNGVPYWSTQTWSYLWVNITTWNTEYNLPGVFGNLHYHGINGSLWTLPVEVRMYIIVLIFYLIGVMGRSSLFNATFFSLLILSYFNEPIFRPLLLHESHIKVIGMFFMGMFYWINRATILINPWILLVMLMFAATTHNTPNFGYAYVILIPYLVFCLAFMPGFGWFNHLGDYSYGVYLYGWPIQQSLVEIFPAISTIQNAIWGCIIAILFGIASWHLVEKPSLKLKHQFLFMQISSKQGVIARIRSNKNALFSVLTRIFKRMY